MNGREISWNGRIYIDEKQITPQEYKEFFERGQFVISFDVANSILRNRADGNLDEVVPADELHEEARNEIKRQILNYYETSGSIECEGQTLNYNWDYEINIDGEDAAIEDLQEWELKKILGDMLDDGCRCGCW